MQNKTDGSRRQKWITRQRFAVLIGLTILIAMMGVANVQLSNIAARSFAPVTVEQTSKVQTAATLLESVGFHDPIYLGIKDGLEASYPTFQVKAIGNETLDVYIRTTTNGGLEIQPTMLTECVQSADDFARIAGEAVFAWEKIPPSMKPRTDGAWGEYESRKHRYEVLKKYVVGDEFIGVVPNETDGWPSK